MIQDIGMQTVVSVGVTRAVSWYGYVFWAAVFAGAVYAIYKGVVFLRSRNNNVLRENKT
jgi:TM2 domain-containing membrane protein YozV